MKNTLNLSLLLLWGSLSFSSCNNPKECLLIGTVHEYLNDTLMLATIHTDSRFITQKIPVVDGKFEYVLKVDQMEAYELNFQSELYSGSWRSINFFPDSKEVIFELYPKEQGDKNIIQGGKFNKEWASYQLELSEIFGSRSPRYIELLKQMDSLENNGLDFTQAYLDLEEKINNTTNEIEKNKLFSEYHKLIQERKVCTPEFHVINDELGQIIQKGDQWSVEYMKGNPGMISYTILMSEILMADDTDLFLDYQECYNILAKKFPNHVYTEIAGDILGGIERIKVGGKFVDFTLPDTEGKMHILSELIDGKVAIIDLWATYCGPCITTTRTYKPIYEEFKNKGFTIVGVAAEENNIDAMVKRIEIEGWEWVNMVDLDRKNNIWHKYNCSFAGGRTLMVDQNGIIVALGPSADEVRSKLEELLSLL